MHSKKERLVLLIKHFGKENNSEFARFLGVSPQTISSWLSRNTFDVDLIYAKCSNISADWLLGGDGEMLRGADGEPSTAKTEPTIIYKSDPLKDEIIELLRKQVATSDKQIAMLEELVSSLKQQVTRMHITDFTGVHSAEHYSDVAVVDTTKTAEIRPKSK